MHTDYSALKQTCIFQTVDTREVDISIIIPVYGRTEFNHVVSQHFKTAIEKINSTNTYADFKVSLTFVEHSPDIAHAHLCKASEWVNHIWIPMQGPFNKCRCFNVGALFSNKAKIYLFHDSDIIVPAHFFIDLMLNFNHGHQDALQAFTGRRVIYCHPDLTNRIIAGSDHIYNAYPGSREVDVGVAGAKGGSMAVKKDMFFKVGGFDEEFSEYSVEDAFFYDKLALMGNIGSADYPPIELVHLFHNPSYNRVTKDCDWAFMQWFNERSLDHKKSYMEGLSNNLKYHYGE